MKKKIIIGVSAAVVVALGVLYFYRAYLFGEDLSKYVPKNAAFVVKIDLMGMGKKLDVKGITESSDFKDALEEVPKEQRELVEKVIKDPKISGLNIATSPTIFGYNNSDEAPIIGVLLGISDKEKLEIFKKFYRVGNENTRNTKGTGLGLFITKQLVDAHNGIIKVENNFNKGTTFTVVL
jgi:hypothetical protein